MALHFVSTSVLTSDNGIDFSNETAIETEEAKNLKLKNSGAANLPLYLQLAQQKDKKKTEYDENTKKIFAPPKALDDEDVNFFEDLNTIKSKALEERAMRENKAVEAFRDAQRKENENHSLIHEENSKSINLFKPAIKDTKTAQKLTTLIGTILKIIRDILITYSKFYC
jgi:hypothetical protein